MTNSKRFLLAIGVFGFGLCGFAAPSTAANSGSSGQVGFAAALDAEFGGDDILKVKFTNGSTQTMHAGQGVGFNVGAHYRPENSKFDFLGTIGYKYVTTAANNADIHLDRVVFKLAAYYDLTDTWWVSAGPVWHTGVHLKGDGFTSDVNFSDAVGFNFSVGWRWIGIGYTNMSYEAERPFVGKVDASNFGIYLQWRGLR